MEENQLVKEYVELIVRLNRGNKIANAKTMLDFEILPTGGANQYQLFAFVAGSGEKNRIILAARDRLNNWERSGCTEFKNLENFCADLLNITEKKNEKKQHISDEARLNLVEVIRNTFKNLNFSDSEV